MEMSDIIDLDRYALDRPGSAPWQALVGQAQSDVSADGMFNLPGFLNDKARADIVAAIAPRIGVDTFRHARRHNIYFQSHVEGLAEDHPALLQAETVNHTLCADQLTDTVLHQLYHWDGFARFLAAVMGKDTLFPMADPLAGLNVMGYREGEALNWHFDRSEFTTTLLLQAPQAGGAFEYARDLRGPDEPSHDAVAALVTGQRAPAVMQLEAGTLNVFRGRNTAHRVTPVKGRTPRIIAVFSYFDRPGVTFSAEEMIGFYGRPA